MKGVSEEQPPHGHNPTSLATQPSLYKSVPYKGMMTSPAYACATLHIFHCSLV